MIVNEGKKFTLFICCVIILNMTPASATEKIDDVDHGKIADELFADMLNNAQKDKEQIEESGIQADSKETTYYSATNENVESIEEVSNKNMERISESIDVNKDKTK